MVNYLNTKARSRTATIDAQIKFKASIHAEYLRAFNRAQTEFWTHAQWLDWREKNVFSHPLRSSMPQHVHGYLSGVFDAMTALLQAQTEHRYLIDGVWTLARELHGDDLQKCQITNAASVWTASAPNFKAWF